jgi:hypothetical protein
MAENGPTSIPVLLRPVINVKGDGGHDLMSKIHLIDQQRDGFRNVTEEELLLEMNESQDAVQVESDSEADDGEEDDRGTLKSILPKGHQMSRSLLYVY